MVIVRVRWAFIPVADPLDYPSQCLKVQPTYNLLKSSVLTTDLPHRQTGKYWPSRPSLGYTETQVFRLGDKKMKEDTAKKKGRIEKGVLLDPDRKSPRAAEFEDKLSAQIVGQERAVRRMSGLFQIYLAGMNNPTRPIGTMLFLGPTGSGKTRVVEAASEVLFNEPHTVVKIDCAEFQHSHEIAKLIGSPPGYLGHRETSPMLTQENLDKAHTDDTKLTFVLFDEIEKASDSLWQLLLGILDKATLTLGDNRRVDFSRTVVIMTSNLGAREMSDMISGGIGFAPTKTDQVKADNEIDTKIYRTALEAAKRKFSPEFINRIDKVVVSEASRNTTCGRSSTSGCVPFRTELPSRRGPNLSSNVRLKRKNICSARASTSNTVLAT